MLTSLKVAPIAFAMKTLHFFRNNKPWISEEIEAYIEKNYTTVARASNQL